MTPTLHSIAIFVTDLERARVFYEDQLGLPVNKAGSFGFEFLDTPPHVGVHPAQHPDALAMVGRHTGLTFDVPDLLNFCSRLGELGVRFVAEPTQQGFGIMAMVADPDGNVIALWEDNVSPPPEAPLSLPRSFASDNTAPAHPAVFDALRAANDGAALPYGADPWTARAIAWFKSQFGEDSEAFLVWNGTGANVVALRAMTRPYHAVICAEPAHINLDECGAPEFLTGCKLIDVPTPDGKLTPAMLHQAVRAVGDEHSSQARVVSVAQPTERGTVYSLVEMRALCASARELDLLVHVDGSRIANAAASLDLPLRAFTRDAGVTILSFGAAKNGCMGAEAVVVFEPALARELKFLRKQSLQLSSKMRFLAAQILALAEGDLWLANARNANAMARRLADGVRGLAGVTILQPVEANAVFAMLPAATVEHLQREFQFYVWNEKTGEVRWMTNWATAPEDVDEFVAAIRVASARLQ